MNRNSIDSLVAGLTAGDSGALARLITWAENRDPRIREILGRIYPHTGSAYRLGITGPPGAGKSTLISRLVALLRERGERVAVVAVDPTSPFSGGALLGDRYRMVGFAEDSGVFMRSMATRGNLGGLAAATEEAMDLLDAAGFTFVLVETVGVGQAEFDIVNAADTVTVVLVPESGDGIQAMKAGLMEIGDVFVVNKSDREGANRLVSELEGMLELRSDHGGWQPEILKTVATRGDGLAELADAVARHRSYLQESGTLAERRRRALELRVLGEARQSLLDRLIADPGEPLDDLLDRVERRELTPHDAARALVDRLSSRTFQKGAGAKTPARKS